MVNNMKKSPVEAGSTQGVLVRGKSREAYRVSTAQHFSNNGVFFLSRTRKMTEQEAKMKKAVMALWTIKLFPKRQAKGHTIKG